MHVFHGVFFVLRISRSIEVVLHAIVVVVVVHCTRVILVVVGVLVVVVFSVKVWGVARVVRVVKSDWVPVQHGWFSLKVVVVVVVVIVGVVVVVESGSDARR